MYYKTGYQTMLYKCSKLLHAFLFLFLIANVYGQQQKLERKNFLSDFVFNGNHIQFNVSTLSILKAQLKNENGNYPVNTKAAVGLLLSFKYQINFNNEYSLITGPTAVLTGRNFITSFNKNDFSPPLVKDYKITGVNSYTAELIMNLPVLAEKRWLYSKTKYFMASAGICLNLSTGPDFDIFFINLMHVNNSFYDAGGVDVYANNDGKPWITYPINAGHAWLLKNNNIIALVITSNVSFTKYVYGMYHVSIPNKPVTNGQYSSTGSYIGLSLHYSFTNANYRIRKAYEKIGY